MKNQIALFVVLLTLSIANAEVTTPQTLPENGKIKVAVLTGSFSCKNLGPLTPLDLSGLISQQGKWFPDLYINFACGSSPEFQGSNLSLIAQIGDVPLEDVDDYKALTPKYVVGESHNFRTAAPIIEGMTYSMVLNTPIYNGLMAFRVVSYKNNILTIEYVTRAYSLISKTATSPWIDYDKKNSR